MCKRGEADLLVCQTGQRTFLGRASAKVKEASVGDAGQHFQKLVTNLTIWTTAVTFVFVAAIVGRLWGLQRPFEEIIATAVVVLIASVPIAIEVVSTVTMAIGAREMADNRALITRLASIEELGAMDILCSDKTGTLTLNRLTVKDPVYTAPGSSFTADDVIKYGCLAAKLEGGLDNLDAIDRVVRQELEHRKISIDNYKQTEFIPFDPVSKRTEGTIVDKSNNDSTFKVTKGAPQVILRMAHNWEEIGEEVSESVLDSAKRGFRTIGVAVEQEGKWYMCGLIQLYDPPRHDTAATVKKAQALGVEVKMITGDQKAIAEETLRQLEMGDLVFTPEVLLETDNECLQALQICNGMAEVFPEHKFDIVQHLQTLDGTRVGMTGDGVNDAPALKAADVGIAVSDCTDAARSAADIVLLDEGLSVIITAIRVARSIFQRLRNYMIFRLCETAQLLIFFFFAIMCIIPSEMISEEEKTNLRNFVTNADGTGPNPDVCSAGITIDQCYEENAPKSFMIPVMALVWITILNDGALLTLAYDNVIPSSMPCKWYKVEMVLQSVLMGIVSGVQNILVLLIGIWSTYPDSEWVKIFFVKRMTYPEVLGMVYLAKSISGFLSVFTSRTGRKPFFVRKPHWALATAALIANGILSFQEKVPSYCRI